MKFSPHGNVVKRTPRAVVSKHLPKRNSPKKLISLKPNKELEAIDVEQHIQTSNKVIDLASIRWPVLSDISEI
jgi:hypothetical protein